MDQKKLIRYITYAAGGICAVVLAGVALLFLMLNVYARDLPDYNQLADYNPPVVSRIYAGNGELITEYANQNRVFVPIEAIPPRVIESFLAAEDKNFYNHPGIDLLSIFRAMLTNVMNIGTDKRLIGASTITQQVAKNFLLTNELSIERKVKEAILAFRIEKAFTKNQILELYLNEIYLGAGAYGVAAASLHYFDKALDELSVAETAYLAALPKAPNNYHPIRNYDSALSRRNWVITRIVEDGHITTQEALQAKAEPLIVELNRKRQTVPADYFMEEVRRRIVDAYGTDELYGQGLYIKATLDPDLQRAAQKALHDGLINYDRRHGWRGPLGQIEDMANWQTALDEFQHSKSLGDWDAAVVVEILGESARIGLKGGQMGFIPLSEMTWAREQLEDGGIGASISKVQDVVSVGDVIIVEAKTRIENGENLYSLRQIPEINGGIVAMDPHSGRVLALVGGYDYKMSEFNRATQAKRQAGSAIKPFVYLTALNAGYTPATLILDAPIVIDQGDGQGKWKPSNYTQNFYGPSPMRLGIEKSRNLMTVRLAQTIGMDKVTEMVKRFSITDRMQPTLAMALGAGETTLLDLTSAYAMLVNGGKKVELSLIDRIQDRRGRILYRHDQRPCENCQGENASPTNMPRLPDLRETVVDPQSAYQIVSMLEGVVQRGTGQRIRAVGKPLAGKTGTTNEVKDTWFVGFSPDLVAGVFVGFDTPKSLGKRESGSSVAAPIFRDFMKVALKNEPEIPFRVPPGIRLVRVNAETGKLASPADKKVILEAFRPGTEPKGDLVLIEGYGSTPDNVPQNTTIGTSPNLGGIY